MGRQHPVPIEERVHATEHALRAHAVAEDARMEVERTALREHRRRFRADDRPSDAARRDVEQRAARGVERVALRFEIGARRCVGRDDKPRCGTDPERRATLRRATWYWGLPEATARTGTCRAASSGSRALPCTFHARGEVRLRQRDAGAFGGAVVTGPRRADPKSLSSATKPLAFGIDEAGRADLHLDAHIRERRDCPQRLPMPRATTRRRARARSMRRDSGCGTTT